MAATELFTRAYDEADLLLVLKGRIKVQRRADGGLLNSTEGPKEAGVGWWGAIRALIFAAGR